MNYDTIPKRDDSAITGHRKKRVSSSTKNNAYSKQKSTVTTEIYPRTPTKKESESTRSNRPKREKKNKEYETP